MTAVELAEWTAANRRTGPTRASSPCDDCQAAFRLEQLAAGLCDGLAPIVEDDAAEDARLARYRRSLRVGKRKNTAGRWSRRAHQWLV